MSGPRESFPGQVVRELGHQTICPDLMPCHLPLQTLQSWRGIKKTGNLSDPLFLAILAGAASFLKPHGSDGGCKSCNVELYYNNINIYRTLRRSVG